MKIIIIEPSNLSHRVRGTGFYTENLLKALKKFYPGENFIISKDISQDADLIHYPFFEPFFLSLPQRKSKKIVVTVHDLTPLKFPRYFSVGVRGFLKWQIQKRALRDADAIITDSQNSKADILSFVGIAENKVHAIYLAAGDEFRQFNDHKAKQSTKNKFNLPDNFLLYVGDVTWNKNLPGLVQAAERINIPLVLVGKALVEKDFDKKNPWNQDLVKVQKTIGKAGNGIIRALGFVGTQDLVGLYNLATIFVMPSFYEGFGLPVLEAMSCGCPVVTSKEGSLEEIGGDSVYYVDPYSVESIASGIKNVFDNPSLANELSKKGLSQAKKFSWEKTAEDTMKVYRSIMMRQK